MQVVVPPCFYVTAVLIQMFVFQNAFQTTKIARPIRIGYHRSSLLFFHITLLEYGYQEKYSHQIFVLKSENGILSDHYLCDWIRSG